MAYIEGLMTSEDGKTTYGQHELHVPVPGAEGAVG